MDGLLLEACEGLQAAKHSCVQVLPHTRNKGVTKELEANSLPTLNGGGESFLSQEWSWKSV